MGMNALTKIKKYETTNSTTIKTRLKEVENRSKYNSELIELTY